MSFKLPILALLICLPFNNQLQADFTWHPGILPYVSFDNEDIVYGLNAIKDNKLKSVGIVSGVLLTGYLTQDYWLLPIENKMKQVSELMNKKDCPCIALHAKESKKEEGNGGKDMLSDFQKCRARIYRPGEIKTRLKDVAGLDAAKADMFDIMAFLKNPKQFTDMGARIPKGVLMQGEPGNGKTLLAKAIAGEVDCPFISISGSEFIEALVGIGAARVRDLFAKAKELAPCIIFIDEFDAVGKKRSSNGFGGGNEESAQTLAQLLTLMDGFDAVKHPIIVLAATNRVDVLDPALLRPGRFDRIVEVSKPFLKDRIDILKIHLGNVKRSDQIDVPLIASATMGFSGAELGRLINDAAIIAVNEQSLFVEMKHVDLAYDNMTIGRETKGMDQVDADMWETAIHESGHSIIRIHLENVDPLYKVTITPRGGALGISYSRPLKEVYNCKENQMKDRIVICLAGGLAEQEFGFGKSTGLRSDLSKARQIAYDMVVKYGMSDALRYISYDEIEYRLPNDIATQVHREVEKIIEECYVRAQGLIVLYKDKIEQLSELLMEKGTVFGDEVYQMCGLEEPKIKYGLDK